MNDDTSAKFLIAITLCMVFGLVVSLAFLMAMFYRGQVKKDLRENNCKPIHIWWIPLAFWNPYWFGTAAFSVIYSDSTRLIHKARCTVYRPLMENPFWGSLRVEWLTDTVTGQLPLPEVWASDEITRLKLGEFSDKPE